MAHAQQSDGKNRRERRAALFKPTNPKSFKPGRLFIGGLNKETTLAALTEYFSRYGKITDIELVANKYTGKSRGFAFLTFANPDSMQAVVAAGPHQLDGRVIDPRPAMLGKTPGTKPTQPQQQQVEKPLYYANAGVEKNRVYVGGIPKDMDFNSEELGKAMSVFGEVKDATVVYSNRSLNRGFGYVTFTSESSTERAIAERQIVIRDQQAGISWALPEEPSKEKKKKPPKESPRVSHRHKRTDEREDDLRKEKRKRVRKSRFDEESAPKSVEIPSSNVFGPQFPTNPTDYDLRKARHRSRSPGVLAPQNFREPDLGRHEYLRSYPPPPAHHELRPLQPLQDSLGQGYLDPNRPGPLPQRYPEPLGAAIPMGHPQDPFFRRDTLPGPGQPYPGVPPYQQEPLPPPPAVRGPVAIDDPFVRRDFSLGPPAEFRSSQHPFPEDRVPSLPHQQPPQDYNMRHLAVERQRPLPPFDSFDGPPQPSQRRSSYELGGQPPQLAPYDQVGRRDSFPPGPPMSRDLPQNVGGFNPNFPPPSTNIPAQNASYANQPGQAPHGMPHPGAEGQQSFTKDMMADIIQKMLPQSSQNIDVSRADQSNLMEMLQNLPQQNNPQQQTNTGSQQDMNAALQMIQQAMSSAGGASNSMVGVMMMGFMQMMQNNPSITPMVLQFLPAMLGALQQQQAAQAQEQQTNVMEMFKQFSQSIQQKNLPSSSQPGPQTNTALPLSISGTNWQPEDKRPDPSNPQSSASFDQAHQIGLQSNQMAQNLFDRSSVGSQSLTQQPPSVASRFEQSSLYSNPPNSLAAGMNPINPQPVPPPNSQLGTAGLAGFSYQQSTSLLPPLSEKKKTLIAPWWSQEMLEIIKQRDEARKSFKQSGDIVHKERFKRLRARFKNLDRDSKRKYCEYHKFPNPPWLTEDLKNAIDERNHTWAAYDSSRSSIDENRFKAAKIRANSLNKHLKELFLESAPPMPWHLVQDQAAPNADDYDPDMSDDSD